MNEQLKGFMHDLVFILHEKYNDTLLSNGKETENENAFRIGMNHAYYDVLDIIESQLNAFSYDAKQIGEITPSLGNQAKLK